MANFPKHLPVQWELFRNEPLKAQLRQEILRHQIEEIDKGRGESDGLWWPDQRYVDVVVPAEYVNPDSLDTFNYRYQVYARPPPVQCPPRSLAEVTEDPPPVNYNVKRIAQCKPLETSLPKCLTHWENRPFVTLCPPEGSAGVPGQSKNNNSCVERPEAPAAEDRAAPVSQRGSCCASPPAFAHHAAASPAPNKWPERCTGTTVLKEETPTQLRDLLATRRAATRLSPMTFAQPLMKNTNRNKGLEDFDLGRCEVSTRSPRSCCSYSTSAASSTHYQNESGDSKTHADLRGHDTHVRSPPPELTSEAGSDFKINEFRECNQVRSEIDRHAPSLSQPDTIACNSNCSVDDKQRPVRANSFNASQTLMQNMASTDEPRAESVRSEIANNANNNERNPSVISRSSLYSPVRVTQSFEGKGAQGRPQGVLSARAPRAEGVRSLLLCEERGNAKVAAVGYGRPLGRQVKRGRRFGYSIPALKDNIASLVFEADRAGNTAPPVQQRAESKPSRLKIFPEIINIITNEGLAASTQGETASLKTVVRKGGKRTGYQVSTVKDSIIFGGGHTKELGPLHHLGMRRSCQTGGYRSMANSDNMRNLIYPQDVNGNNAADWTEDPDSDAPFNQRDVIVDVFILEGEEDQRTACQEPFRIADSGTADVGLPILPVDFAVPGCTNNNSAITDPILDIQLDCKCMLQARPRANTDASAHADGAESAVGGGRKTPEIPYESYKIVGGKQYKSRPPEDLLSKIQLPPHLAEYQEFIRRCPNYNLGRYDRSDPSNEMLLPGSKSMNTLRMTVNPFMYSRNPNLEKTQPLFYTTTGNSDLKWPLAASKCDGDRKELINKESNGSARGKL